jgi:hypothetical protein
MKTKTKSSMCVNKHRQITSIFRVGIFFAFSVGISLYAKDHVAFAHEYDDDPIPGVEACGVWSHIAWENEGEITWAPDVNNVLQPTASDASEIIAWSDPCSQSVNANDDADVEYTLIWDDEHEIPNPLNILDTRTFREVIFRAESAFGGPHSLIYDLIEIDECEEGVDEGIEPSNEIVGEIEF